jgi:hypothetical protein
MERPEPALSIDTHVDSRRTLRVFDAFKSDLKRRPKSVGGLKRSSPTVMAVFSSPSMIGSIAFGQSRSQESSPASQWDNALE